MTWFSFLGFFFNFRFNLKKTGNSTLFNIMAWLPSWVYPQFFIFNSTKKINYSIHWKIVIKNRLFNSFSYHGTIFVSLVLFSIFYYYSVHLNIVSDFLGFTSNFWFGREYENWLLISFYYHGMIFFLAFYFEFFIDWRKWIVCFF